MEREITAELRRWVEERAAAAGFDCAGVAAVPEPESAEAVAEDGRFAAWVEAGRAGEMEYLKRVDDGGGLVRGSLRRAMPWARSVMVFAVNYNAQGPLSVDEAEAGAGWIARYAWSGDGEGPSDYHDVLLPKLKVVERELRERVGGDLETRCYVDTGPVGNRLLKRS